MKKFIDYLKEIKNQMQISMWININIKASIRIVLLSISLWILYNGFYIIAYNSTVPNILDTTASMLTITMMLLFIQCVIFYSVLMIMLYKRFSKRLISSLNSNSSN